MKKVELKYIDKGYSYIECTKEDCYKWGGLGICNGCDKRMEDKVYLIFILHRAYCKKCFEDWQKYSRRYEEDIQLQKESHIDWYNAYGFEVVE